MKYLLLIISLSLFISCTDDDSNNTPPELIGSWKLVEVCYSTHGESCTWTIVSEANSHIYNYYTNGVVTQDLYSPNCEGTFSVISGNILKVNFPCNNLSLCWKVNSITNTNLNLDCVIIDGCDNTPIESCAYKYERI